MQPLSASQMEVLEEATSAYQGAVGRAAGYLMGRGIKREEAATHRLGVVEDPIPGHEKFQGMLAIPYLDRYDRPISMRFRCLQEHDHRKHYHGKYMSLPDEPVRLYGIKDIFEAGDVIHTTEGELDRIVLKRLGLHVVGVPGAETFAWRHQKMLAGFSRIWHWADPDEAGANLVRTMTKRLRNTKPVKLEAGDVTDTYKQGGLEALRAIAEAL